MSTVNTAATANYGHVFIVLVVVIGLSTVETLHHNEVRPLCKSQVTCATCIGADVQCSWCYDRDYQYEKCDLLKKHTDHGCNGSRILNPSKVEKLLEDTSLSDTNKILMKPQKIRLQIRPHEKAEIPLKFLTTKDHAVDLYFVMDLSATMQGHIKELSHVSMELVDNIRKLTGSLQVGIGSFVDRIIPPYGYCERGNNCGYSFNQRLNLTNDFIQFGKAVASLSNLTTNNIDTPEGGLDALMQSLVCEDKIGWRENSRKLIVYCSDASFHYAGDGQLGGFVVPNDGECQMTNNVYAKEYTQDYPSVQHIAQIVNDKKVTIIFAIAGQDQQQIYHRVSQEFSSSYVSELGDKKSTIANIVTDGYKNITSTVEMKAYNRNFDLHLSVDFHSNCTGEWTKKHKCRTKLGEVVDFKAIITAPGCPEGNQSFTQSIHIRPINSDSQLEIEVELICKCDCEQKEANSSMCSGNGKLNCGECICDEGFSGQRCDCDHRNREQTRNCIMENSTMECSGRGSCECGLCLCHYKPSNRNQAYSGTYCECDDYKCPNYDGSLCGGYRGECKCGECICNPGYTGNDCHCPISQENCKSENNKTCNGHGQCECGVCTCDKDSGFIGDTCDNCPTCNDWCEINKKCVECWMSEEGGSQLECGRLCKMDNVSIVDSFELHHSVEEVSKVCSVEIDKCIIRHQTVLDYGKELLRILKERECPKSDSTKSVIGIVVGIFVLGVIILAIWKLVTTIVDRRELARFEKERALAAWTTQNNPLFVQSSTTYENPTWVLNG